MKIETSAPEAIQDKLQPLTDGRFRFACHPGVPCFTECCRDLRLLLTPYDLARLKNHLGLTSSELIDRYLELKPDETTGLPLAFLSMLDNPRRTCPFVTAKGCRVYAHRPSACRTYPLARASRKHAVHGAVLEAYYVLHEDHCRGFEQPNTFEVEGWVADQGLAPYHDMNNLWMEIATHRALRQRPLTTDQTRLVYLAAYDLDRFRRMVFDSGFLNKFKVAEALLESARADDEGLLRLGFAWIRLVLFQDSGLPVTTR